MMFHIGLEREQVRDVKYAILPGDPGRCEAIAKLLDNYYYLGTNREYTSYIGSIKGNKVLVISTGMGGPSTAICVEELHMLGINNLIRVGTCGGMQLDIIPGDIIIAQASVRAEGTSKEYLPVEVPAIADFDIVSALKKATEELGYPYHLGIVHSKDSFYGQHSPERMPVGDLLNFKWKSYIDAGVLASEMETAALFSVATTLGMKAGAVLLAIWNQEQQDRGIDLDSDFDTSEEIKVAIKAIDILINN